MFYPKAEQHLIPAGANDPEITPVGVVLHVAASSPLSLFGFFNGPSKGIESHFYIRRDGTVEQYRGTGHEADAQFEGNSWTVGTERFGFISVETAGFANGRWNKAQLAAIQDLLLWAHDAHGIPLRKVSLVQPPTLAAGGVGFHTQFARWSNVPGKTCPGPRRKVQFAKVLLPWMREQRTPCLHCPRHCPPQESK